MSLYVVGDIQGCYRELMALLERVSFSHQHDQLWCVGDIVARGPDSLDALRFFVDNDDGSVRTVLGNHDLNLIGVLLGQRQANPKDRLASVISSSRRLDWIDWLRQQPLWHHHSRTDVAIAHAGCYPWWSAEQAASYAAEVESVLQSQDFESFITEMFGNEPSRWDSSLQGFDRYRFIVNAFTRMRYCDNDGNLEFSHKSHPDQLQDVQWRPWFEFYQGSQPIAFGHWAALMGDTHQQHLVGLDTGCVWGNHMTLWDVDNQYFYQQPAITKN